MIQRFATAKCHVIIIIIHEFHCDASLGQNFRDACDAFQSEAIYEADKALKCSLEKFPAVPREYACL